MCFSEQECHLLWGDVCGYIWAAAFGREASPPKRALVRAIPAIVVPIVNEREQQTYYGAWDYFNQEFLVQAYPRANSEHTISFLNYLQAQRPHQRIAIIWDGAFYHRSQELKDYLQSLNTLRSSAFLATYLDSVCP